MISRNRRHWVQTTSAMLLSLAASGTLAQTEAGAWKPQKPIRFVVGFAPGGSSDTLARLIAPKLEAALGQPVVVQNQPGAGGFVAASSVVRAAPDGHTWLMVPSGHATMAAMRADLPFDPIQDFSWISTINSFPMVIAVAPNSPLHSLADLSRAERENPGKLTYSSVGIGTAHHLIGEWLNAEGRMEMTHVPFKGGVAGATEVMAGRVDVLIETMTLALPFITSGKIRALAVTSGEPVQDLPSIPTASQTFPGINYESWLGVALPPKTPQPIVARLNAEMRKVLQQPDVQERIAALGGRPAPASPAEFKARLERDIANFRSIVTSRKIVAQ